MLNPGPNKLTSLSTSLVAGGEGRVTHRGTDRPEDTTRSLFWRYQNGTMESADGRCSAIEGQSPYFRTTSPITDAVNSEVCCLLTVGGCATVSLAPATGIEAPSQYQALASRDLGTRRSMGPPRGDHRIPVWLHTGIGRTRRGSNLPRCA